LTHTERKGRLSSFFFPHTSGDEILIGAAAFPFGSYFIHQIVKLQRTPSDAMERVREGLRLIFGRRQTRLEINEGEFFFDALARDKIAKGRVKDGRWKLIL
jgi:hypothetical protein